MLSKDSGQAMKWMIGVRIPSGANLPYKLWDPSLLFGEYRGSSPGRKT